MRLLKKLIIIGLVVGTMMGIVACSSEGASNNTEENTTIIMVTHDVSVVNSNKKRTIALEAGHMVADLSSGGYLIHE